MMIIKDFLRDNKKIIFGILMLAFIAATLIGFYFPDSTFGKLVIYYSKLSSLIIVLLTFAYVITTNRQLYSMEKQLELMDSSVKLQLQPLPVPSVDNVKLEKIRPYLSPDTIFSKVELLSRFHFDVNFKNAGTGAALNTTVFASILIKNRKNKKTIIEIPQRGPNQIHLICEDEKQLETFMLIDKDFELLKSFINHDDVILRLKIYYKNIFGSGFLEKADYSLRVKSEQDETFSAWKSIPDEGLQEYNDDIVRFESLKWNGDRRIIVDLLFFLW